MDCQNGTINRLDTLFSHLNHSILFLYSCFLGHDDDNVVNFVKSAIANIMGLYSQFALRDYTVSQCLGSTSVSLIVAHCQKKIFLEFTSILFLTFPVGFCLPIIFSNLNYNCSDLSDLRNLQEQIKKAFWFKNCSGLNLEWIVLVTEKNFWNSRLNEFFLQKVRTIWKQNTILNWHIFFLHQLYAFKNIWMIQVTNFKFSIAIVTVNSALQLSKKVFSNFLSFSL